MKPRNRKTAILWLAALSGGFLLSRQMAVVPQKPGVPFVPRLDTANTSQSPAAGESAYAAQLRDADPAKLRRLFAEYDALADPLERREAMRWLMARWAECDPRDGVAFFRERGAREETAGMLGHWALLDPETVSGEMQAQKEGTHLDGELMRWLCFRDPRIALRFGLAYPAGSPLAQVLLSRSESLGLSLLAKTDLPGTLRLLERLYPDGKVPYSTFSQVARGAAMNDQEAALQWAKSLGDKKNNALTEIISEMASSDPARAAREFKESPYLREAARYGDGAGFLAADIAARLGLTDPAKAMQWIQETVAKEENRAGIAAAAASGILKNALTDPAKLAEVYDTLQPYLKAEDFKHVYLKGPQIPAALETVSGFPRGPVRDHLITALAIQSFEFALSDPVATLKWLDQISDPAASRYLAGVITSSPKTAAQAEAVLQTLPASLQASALSNLAEVQASQDGAAAVAWAQSLTHKEWQERALPAVVHAWAERSALDASAWVETLPAGATRDVAATALARGIAEREPTAAVTWGLSISDPEMQSKSLDYVFAMWQDRMPDAARLAVETSTLPEPVRQRLLSKLVPP